MSTRELLPDHAPLFDHGGFDVHPIARPGYGAFLVTAYGAVGTGTTVVPLRRPCSP
jgi:hypothetical protein